MEFLADYASFLAKTVTVVVAIIAVLLFTAAVRGRNRRSSAGQLQVQKLNDFYRDLRLRLQQSVLGKEAFKALRKRETKAEKTKRKSESGKSRVYVLDFHGDIKATANEHLRNEITAVLTLATPKDEVVVRLESGGGLVRSWRASARRESR